MVHTYGWLVPRRLASLVTMWLVTMLRANGLVTMLRANGLVTMPREAATLCTMHAGPMHVPRASPAHAMHVPSMSQGQIMLDDDFIIHLTAPYLSIIIGTAGRAWNHAAYSTIFVDSFSLSNPPEGSFSTREKGLFCKWPLPDRDLNTQITSLWTEFPLLSPNKTFLLYPALVKIPRKTEVSSKTFLFYPASK